MKKLSNLLFVAILLFLIGCSSDDGGASSLPTENSFSVTIDNTVYNFDTFNAIKNFDNYEVLGSNNNQENFYIRFNDNGVLDRANFYTSSGNFLYFNSSFFFPSDTFNLTNLNIDQNNSVVAGNISGLIYEDDIDLTSNILTVNNGAFNLAFIDMTQTVDIFIDADIAGSSFESMKHVNSSTGGNFVELTGVSDDEESIAIKVNPDDLVVGSYDFASTNELNSVIVEYYNPYDDVYERYSSSGTLVIDEVSTSGFQTLIKGSFTATATNENGDTISISNGEFSYVL